MKPRPFVTALLGLTLWVQGLALAAAPVEMPDAAASAMEMEMPCHGDAATAPCDCCDGDCNERQITLTDPSGFRVGDGVAVSDRTQGGFGVTTATLTEQIDANTFRISAPLYLDYMVSQQAAASLAFPVVGGWQVKNVTLEGLTVDGNREKAEADVARLHAHGLWATMEHPS